MARIDGTTDAWQRSQRGNWRLTGPRGKTYEHHVRGCTYVEAVCTAHRIWPGDQRVIVRWIGYR